MARAAALEKLSDQFVKIDEGLESERKRRDDAVAKAEARLAEKEAAADVSRAELVQQVLALDGVSRTEAADWLAITVTELGRLAALGASADSAADDSEPAEVETGADAGGGERSEAPAGDADQRAESAPGSDGRWDAGAGDAGASGALGAERSEAPAGW